MTNRSSQKLRIQALHMLYGRDLEEAIQNSLINVSNPRVTFEFLPTGFNVLLGKWEGIANPTRETINKARWRLLEHEQKIEQTIMRAITEYDTEKSSTTCSSGNQN